MANNTVYVYPLTGSLNGAIIIPSSKSHTQRVLALAMVTEGISYINGIGQSADERAVLEVVKKVAKKCVVQGSNVMIEGVSAANIPEASYNVGESGLATRMLTPILANSIHRIQVAGKGSVLKRPMLFFDEVLPLLNVHVDSNDGFLPINIKGPIKPTSLSVDGSLSSQYITGLVYGLVTSKKLTNEQLRINKLTSKPYLEMSLAVLNQFGVHLNLEEDCLIQFNGPYSLQPATVQIEGDWSSASFFLVAGALYGNMRITNLDIQSTQADKDILHALAATGAKISVENGVVKVEKNENNGFVFDATNCPDLFPPLAVLAAYASSVSTIKGIHRLTHKESNRALTIQSEFGKLGITIELDESKDIMIIHPVEKCNGGKFNAQNDHRIAMAGAILALNATEPVQIEGAEAVNKSFVEFWEMLFRVCEK